jgi:transposase
MATWLYSIVKPLVAELIVCNPRHNSLLKSGNKSDLIDADKLAELLRTGSLKAVYHASAQSVLLLKELTHSYNELTEDRVRVMNRIKSVFRSEAVACSSRDVFKQTARDAWLEKLSPLGKRERVSSLYSEFDSLTELRRVARRKLLAEVRTHSAYKRLMTVPGLGAIRVAEVLAAVMTPFRFRTKRQFWAYCGLAVVTRSSSDFRFDGGRLVRQLKKPQTRGLNSDYNHRLKKVFKAAALDALKEKTFKSYYERLRAGGLSAELARVQVARKIAAVTLSIFKSREQFDEQKVMAFTV